MSFYRATKTSEIGVTVTLQSYRIMIPIIFPWYTSDVFCNVLNIWENSIRFIKAPKSSLQILFMWTFYKPWKDFPKVLIWLSKMQSLIWNNYMPFKGTWKLAFASILRNNKVNIPTGTNWLNSIVNNAFKLYNIWELKITHPFFLDLLFLQQYPEMSTKNIEVEMREKKNMYFTLGCLPWTFSLLELIW